VLLSWLHLRKTSYLKQIPYFVLNTNISLTWFQLCCKKYIICLFWHMKQTLGHGLTFIQWQNAWISKDPFIRVHTVCKFWFMYYIYIYITWKTFIRWRCGGLGGKTLNLYANGHWFNSWLSFLANLKADTETFLVILINILNFCPNIRVKTMFHNHTQFEKCCMNLLHLISRRNRILISYCWPPIFKFWNISKWYIT
jgi:hypothetical protein